MNFWDILILLLIGGAVAAAVRILKGKKESGGCTCGCGGCAKSCPARLAGKEKTNR